MGILLGFGPFIAFAVLDRFFGPTVGLMAGALVSAGLLLRDWLIVKRAPKILEIGTFGLFGSLAIYTFARDPAWSVIGVRLIVDLGLLLIVLLSMAIGQPFTLQYARESVAKEHWDTPRFRKTSYVITGVWALAFLILVLADLVMLYMPEVPLKVGIFVTIGALLGAVKFTKWYPERVRKQAATNGA